MKKLLTAIVLCFVVFSLSAKTMTNPAPDSVFTFTSKLYYPVNVTKRIDSYMENANALKAIATLKKDNFTVESIKISGWASPESPIHYNQILSEKRAATIKKAVKDQYGYSEDLFVVEGKGEQWSGIIDLIDSNDEIACKYMEEFKLAMAKENSDEREKAIKAIGNGELYKHIFETVYPKMRYADCVIRFRCSNLSDEDAEILGITFEEPAAPAAQPEEPVVAAPVVAIVDTNPTSDSYVDVKQQVDQIVVAAPKPKVWRLSFTIGPQVYWGDNDKFMDYKDRIQIGVNADVQRWINPYLGVGLGLNAYKMYGLYVEDWEANGDNPKWRDEPPYFYRHRDKNNRDYFRQRGFIMNPYLFAVTNLTNDFWGVKKGGRRYNLLMLIGGGINITENRVDKEIHTGFSLNMNLVNAFRISEVLDLILSIHGTATNEWLDGEMSYHLLDGTYSLQGGIAVHF